MQNPFKDIESYVKQESINTPREVIINRIAYYAAVYCTGSNQLAAIEDCERRGVELPDIPESIKAAGLKAFLKPLNS